MLACVTVTRAWDRSTTPLCSAIRASTSRRDPRITRRALPPPIGSLCRPGTLDEEPQSTAGAGDLALGGRDRRRYDRRVVGREGPPVISESLRSCRPSPGRRRSMGSGRSGARGASAESPTRRTGLGERSGGSSRPAPGPTSVSSSRVGPSSG